MVILSRPESLAASCSHSRLWREPGRDRLSNTCTFALVSVSRWCARFEPINPAPPKMTTERKSRSLPLPFDFRGLDSIGLSPVNFFWIIVEEEMPLYLQLLR